MLRPLLVIGIGGSGGKTIRSMKQALERRLLSVRYNDGIPAAWQFLQIDTTYDGVNFPAPMLSKNDVQVVVPPGATFETILKSMTNRATLDEQHKIFAGWGIATTAVSVANGAGQIRGIGRQVGVADSARTLDAIKSAIAKMNAPLAKAELASVAKALGAEPPFDGPQAFIISSLAGGSGAGMFMDVAELLKRATSSPWAHESVAFLYTSEVFDSLGDGAKDVSKNSLGAMNEIIAGKWVPVSDRTEMLFEKLGVVAQASSSRVGYGCKGNIFIGKTNKTGIDISQGADGAGMDEVFLTIGEALAATIASDDISEWLFQVALVNILETKSAIDLSGLAPENAANPTFSAAGIGFGQLTLGADRIVEYVADALTYKQVSKLLWPEMDQSLLKDGITTIALIQQKTDQVWPTFLTDSGLDERGTQNQIIDSLYPKEWDKEISQFVVGLIKQSLADKETPLARFANVVWSSWESDAEECLLKLKTQINKNAQKWVPSIQSSFRDLIAKELVESGYSVVISLVDKLIEELRDHVLPELRHEHGDFASAVRSFDKALYMSRITSIADGLSGVTLQNKQFLEKLSKDLCKVLESQVNSHISDLASSLVDDMLTYFFTPLKRTLADKRFELQKQEKDATLPDGSKNLFSRFPRWGTGVVPNAYKPRTIERILIDVADYESIYELQSKPDAGGKPSFQSSINASLLGVKMNPKPGDKNLQELIQERSPWTTSVRDAQDQMGAAVVSLDWIFKTDLISLGIRNRKWLKDADTAFGKFTNMTINEFVSDPDIDPKLRSLRESKFEKEFSAMLGLAQPLIMLNPQAMNYVVSVKDGQPAIRNLLRASKIPFDINSPIGQACTRTLQSAGINVQDGNFAATWFDPASRATTMQAAATTQSSLPAWAFASLTDPILKQASESKNEAGTWTQFWEDRRTRPLTEAVPFETEMRRSIITGWFIASIFGLRKVDKIATGKTVQIWNPTLQNPGWSSFPEPLLNTHLQDMNRDWVLPAILTSAGLAMSEFGRTGSTTSIQPYLLLKYIGREVTTQIPNRDKWDANGVGDLLPTQQRSQAAYLKDWLHSGVKPSDSLPLLNLVEDALKTNSDRRGALMQAISTLKTQYENAWKQFEQAPWHQLPETWELKEEIELALSDIFNYVSSVQATVSTTSA